MRTIDDILATPRRRFVGNTPDKHARDEVAYYLSVTGLNSREWEVVNIPNPDTGLTAIYLLPLN